MHHRPRLREAFSISSCDDCEPNGWKSHTISTFLKRNGDNVRVRVEMEQGGDQH